MIVADFDEFLFCPKAEATPKAQELHIKRVVENFTQEGFDQLTFPQVVVANTTTSTRDCVVENTKSNISIFNCFAAFRYIGNLIFLLKITSLTSLIVVY